MKLDILYENVRWRDIIKGAAASAGVVTAASLIGQHNISNQSDQDKYAIAQSEIQPELKTQFKPEIQLDKSKLQSKSKNAGFNFVDFRNRLKYFEGYSNKAYKVQKGEIAIGIGHTMVNPTAGKRTAVSRDVFRRVFGNNVNFDEILNGKHLTDDQVSKLADYDIKKHLNRAERIFPLLYSYPEEVQFAIVDSIYRGDMGPKTAKLINAGRWMAAADEYINHRGYMTAKAKGLSGIVTRMNTNRAVMLQYAKEVGQE